MAACPQSSPLLSLAVGVGANAALFSVGHAMLARPLPYAGADRLVMLQSTNPSHGVFVDDDRAGEPARLAGSGDILRGESPAIAGGVSISPAAIRSERLRGLFNHARVLQSSRRAVDRQDVRMSTPSPIPGGAGPTSLSAAGLAAPLRIGTQVLSVELSTSASINLNRVGATPICRCRRCAGRRALPPLSADYNLGVAGIGDAVDFWMPRSPQIRPDVTAAISMSSRDCAGSLARARPVGDGYDFAQSCVAHPDTNNGLSVRLVSLRDQVLGSSSRVLFLLFASTDLCSWSHAGTSRTCCWLAPQCARKKWRYAWHSVPRGFASCDSSWPNPCSLRCRPGRSVSAWRMAVSRWRGP